MPSATSVETRYRPSPPRRNRWRPETALSDFPYDRIVENCAGSEVHRQPCRRQSLPHQARNRETHQEGEQQTRDTDDGEQTGDGQALPRSEQARCFSLSSSRGLQSGSAAHCDAMELSRGGQRL
jgi:hypothetical protein